MILVGVLSIALATLTSSNPTVTIESTTFVGNFRENIEEFMGIKYATANRFEDPVLLPIASLPRVVIAQAPGDMCIQTCTIFPFFTCVEKQSEDCLYLNIYTPTLTRPLGDRCVIFYMHGGLYQEGSGGGLVYNGFRISDPDVGGCILVTINYRLGILGYLGERNLGFKDQVMAFKWVVKYIQYFGGDRKKITVMGQSVGCISAVLFQNLTLLYNQFIKRVVLNSCPFALHFRNRAESVVQENQFKAATGCDTTDNVTSCYNGLTTREILRHQHDPKVSISSKDFLVNFAPWGPSIDGILIHDHAFNLYKKNRVRAVETIIGTTSADGYPFIQTARVKVTDFYDIVDSHHLNLAPFRLLYNFNSTVPIMSLSKMATDYMFRCPARAITLMLSKKNIKSFRYVFNQTLPLSDDRCRSLACHSIDNPFWFGAVANLSQYTFSIPNIQQNIALSTIMIKYLTNFADTGAPNKREGFFRFSPPVFWTSVGGHVLPNMLNNALILSADEAIRMFDPFFDKEVIRCQFLDRLDIYNPK